jgi:thioredoxin-like negative regulator of GroEL
MTWVDQRHDQLLELVAVLTAPENRELATDETYEELLTLDRAHQNRRITLATWIELHQAAAGLATSPDVAAQPADHPLRVALATVTSLHKDYRRHIGNNHHH